MTLDNISSDLFCIFLEDDIDNNELFFDADTPPAITKDPRRLYHKKEMQHELQLIRLESKHAQDWAKFNEAFAETAEKIPESEPVCYSDILLGTTALELLLTDIKETISCATAVESNPASSLPTHTGDVDTNDHSNHSSSSNVTEDTMDVDEINEDIFVDVEDPEDDATMDSETSKLKRKMGMEKKTRKKMRIENKVLRRKYREAFNELKKKQQEEIKCVLTLQLAELNDLPEEYQRRKLQSLPSHLQDLLRDKNEEDAATMPTLPLKRTATADEDAKDRDMDTSKVKKARVEETIKSEKKKKKDSLTADGRDNSKNSKVDDKNISSSTTANHDSMKKSTSTTTTTTTSFSSTCKSSSNKSAAAEANAPSSLKTSKKKDKHNKYKPTTSSPLVTGAAYTKIDVPSSSSSLQAQTQQPLFFNHPESSQKKKGRKFHTMLGPNCTLFIRNKPRRSVIIRDAEGHEQYYGDPVDYNDAIFGIKRDNNPVFQRLMDGRQYLFYRNEKGKVLTIGTTAQIQPQIKKYFLSQ